MPVFPIVLRVDGNSKMGLGHIYRCIALASILKEKFDIIFLTSHTTLIAPIIESKFDYKLIPHNINVVNEPAWLQDYYNDYLIVLDGYQFDEEYQRKLRQFNFTFVYIDDLNQGVQMADLVINHTPGIEPKDYQKLENTELALGLKYALLRPSFLDFERDKLNQIKSLSTLFITFGGADPDDFTYKTVVSLKNFDSISKINIVLGAAYEHKDIDTINDSRVCIYRNLSEDKMLTLMKDSDLAITPASTTCLELASLGVPMLLGYFVENQQKIYYGLMSKECVYGLGDFKKFNFAQLAEKVIPSIILKDLNFKRKRMVNLFSSNQKNNILSLFEKYKPLNLRRVHEQDLDFIFKLSNEVIVRQNSFNTEQIKYEDHKEWFLKEINSRNLFYIIEYNKKPVGQVRFRMFNEHSIIGISISNIYRGKGFAHKGLRLVINEYFKKNTLPIFAYIKKANGASVKLFKKVGFLLYKEEPVNKVQSVIYKLKNEDWRF